MAVVKSLTVPVLTVTFSNAGTVRLAEILLVTWEARTSVGWSLQVAAARRVF